MKRLLLSFLPALAAAGIVSVALYMKAGPPSVITPASVAPAMIRPVAVSETVKPEPLVPQGGDRLGRWESMAGTAGQLLAVHVEIRELGLADFPAVCVEALRLKEAARHPLMRLLCIRWAELDGLAALNWVKEQFLEPKEGWRWTEMPKEIGSAWFAAQPAQASQWFSSFQKGPRQENVDWDRLIRGVPWGSGSAMAMAESIIDRPGQLTGTAAGTEAFAAQISTTAEIAALKEMVTEKRTSWPTRHLLPDGSIHTVNWKPAGLLIAAAYEKAWPRIDPEGWRDYAKEKVIGADGSHLPLHLAKEDCRSSADPEATARKFLQSAQARTISSQELVDLIRVVESREAGRGLPLLYGTTGPVAALALAQLAVERNPGNLPAVVETAQRMTDPVTRRKALQQVLTTWPVETAAENWLQMDPLPQDDIDTIRELRASIPIIKGG